MVSLNLISISLLYLSLNFSKSLADYKLDWSDEFNTSAVDTNKWKVHNQENSCRGQSFYNEINCYSESIENVLQTDGTLAITAKFQQYLESNFTSGYVWSKKQFTFGKLEIRAALPSGDKLFTLMSLWPPISPNKVYEQYIIVNIYKQLKTLENWIVFNNNNNESAVETNTDKDLKEFHIYSVEWNQTNIIWKLDSEVTHSYAFQRIQKDLPMRLHMVLGVGGSLFNPKLDINLQTWECPSFIIDYVRHYKWFDNYTLFETNKKDDNPVKSRICNAVRESGRPEQQNLTTTDTVTDFEPTVKTQENRNSFATELSSNSSGKGIQNQNFMFNSNQSIRSLFLLNCMFVSVGIVSILHISSIIM